MVIFLSINRSPGLKHMDFYAATANFGKLPSGERLERIEKSPHYKEGQFQRLYILRRILLKPSQHVHRNADNSFSLVKTKTGSHPPLCLQGKLDLVNLDRL